MQSTVRALIAREAMRCLRTVDFCDRGARSRWGTRRSRRHTQADAVVRYHGATLYPFLFPFPMSIVAVRAIHRTSVPTPKAGVNTGPRFHRFAIAVSVSKKGRDSAKRRKCDDIVAGAALAPLLLFGDWLAALSSSRKRHLRWTGREQRRGILSIMTSARRGYRRYG